MTNQISPVPAYGETGLCGICGRKFTVDHDHFIICPDCKEQFDIAARSLADEVREMQPDFDHHYFCPQCYLQWTQNGETDICPGCNFGIIAEVTVATPEEMAKFMPVPEELMEDNDD